MNRFWLWLLGRWYRRAVAAMVAEPTGWDAGELHDLVEETAAERHGPTAAEYEARAWALIAEMDRQHALAEWWHCWESQAGGYAADLAVMPVLLDGLPEVPKPARTRARRVKA